MRKSFGQLAVSFLLGAFCTTRALASTPAALDMVGYVPDVGQAKDLAIDAGCGLAYVASMQFGLAVVDVTTPRQPLVVSTTNPALQQIDHRS
jgi:hypothetical protein